MSIRITIVDDHDILRAGLRRIIETESDMEVVAEFGTVADTLAQFSNFPSDVVILDLALPDGDGLSLLDRLKQVAPATKILILTMYTDAAHFQAAVSQGAMGYLVKSEAFQKLVQAIRALHAGQTFFWLNATIGPASVMPRRVERKWNVHPAESAVQRLTPREREILGLVAQGHTSQEIANLLQLSRKTIETYRAKVMDKLSLTKRAELVQFALHHGIVATGTSATI